MNEKRIEIINITLENIKKYAMGNPDFKTNISHTEWETFSNVLYESVVIKKIEKSFCCVLNLIINNAVFMYMNIRYEINEVYLVKDNEYKKYYTNRYFTLDNLLNSLWTLQAFEFNTLEIEEIDKEIRSRCLNIEIVDIKNLVKKE